MRRDRVSYLCHFGSDGSQDPNRKDRSGRQGELFHALAHEVDLVLMENLFSGARRRQLDKGLELGVSVDPSPVLAGGDDSTGAEVKPHAGGALARLDVVLREARHGVGDCLLDLRIGISSILFRKLFGE